MRPYRAMTVPIPSLARAGVNAGDRQRDVANGTASPAARGGHGVREHGGDVRGLHELRRHVHERDLRAVG